MRGVVVLLAATGCRQLLGLHDLKATDAAVDVGEDSDAAIDGPVDAVVDVPVDACPDADGDGVCDAVDAWPCGPAPAPISMVMVGGGDHSLLVTAISLDATVVAPGTTIHYGFHFDLQEMRCSTNCIDQIEVGIVPGARFGCVFDSPVPKATGVTGNASQMFVAPAALGAYDIRVAQAANYACTYQGATNWFTGTPPAGNTIAHICVR